MKTFMKIGTAVVAGGTLVVILIWRYAGWPCPSWLIVLLENPFFRWVAGAEMLLERAGVTSGMTVLDAGCGPGRLTLPAAQRVGETGRVMALDLQPTMLARLRQRLETSGLTNVEVVQAALGEGELPLGRFDAAFLITVLGEVPHKAAALEEIFKSLRPGGLLSITETLPDPHYQTLGKVRQLAHAAGFEIGEIYNGLGSYTIHLRKPGPNT